MKIVIRRIHGAVNVRGLVLFPVATEGQAVVTEMQKLAAVLGDPLSPENPLAKSRQNVARNAKVEIHPNVTSPAPIVRLSEPSVPTPAPPPAVEPAPPEGGVYPAAVISATEPGLPAPVDGLAAYWNFDRAGAVDSERFQTPR